MRVLAALVGQIFALDILLSENEGSDYCSNITTFTTDLDHFSFDDRKTDIRVITDDRFYQPGGPVLFYTGNEGAIELFCENTGFQREAAEQLGAKVVFMEHRYYGKSVPDKKMTYLSAEQALADFADYLDNLKRTENVGPVVALGGSYGGMLAAYIRIKEFFRHIKLFFCPLVFKNVGNLWKVPESHCRFNCWFSPSEVFPRSI